MRLTVVGAGYVGLASALAFAATGHEVVCVERDPDRLALLRRREDPLGEPGVATLLTSTRARFVNADPELDRAELVLVAVGTPMRRDDHADLAQVHDACRVLAVGTRTGAVVAIRSTVPVGTCDHLQADVLPHQLVVSNPEFLREGRAIEDTTAPTRIVAGGPPAARPVIEELYAGIRARSAAPIPLLWTTSRSAELAKYAANGFLATKLSFVNEVANLADVVGADAGAVLRSMALDPRIGAGHLRPGLGWGGSCFPKDTRALAALAAGEGYDFIVLKAAIEQNNRQLAEFAGMIERETPAGPTIGMLGLAFKAGTADTRESSALALAERLAQTGKRVHAYDPAVRSVPCAAIARVDGDPLAACVDADAVVIATDWPEFASLDLPALRAVTRGDLIFDGRGMIDPARADAAGFRYRGTGPTSILGGAP
ncbi:MAG TPA: UDP-glucose/GDP-mannose dehydrogenase family protein [Candidatus Limnocylindria bacterium]